MPKFKYTEAGGTRTAILESPEGYTLPPPAVSFVDTDKRLVTFVLEGNGYE